MCVGNIKYLCVYGLVVIQTRLRIGEGFEVAVMRVDSVDVRFEVIALRFGQCGGVGDLRGRGQGLHGALSVDMLSFVVEERVLGPVQLRSRLVAVGEVEVGHR